MYMTILVTCEDGSILHHFRQLCTSPTQFRNILEQDLKRFSSDPSWRPMYAPIPLREVQKEIADWERVCSPSPNGVNAVFNGTEKRTWDVG